MFASNLVPRRHFILSGSILDRHNLGVHIQVVTQVVGHNLDGLCLCVVDRGQGCVKYPTVHGIAPHSRELPESVRSASV